MIALPLGEQGVSRAIDFATSLEVTFRCPWLVGIEEPAGTRRALEPIL